MHTAIAAAAAVVGFVVGYLSASLWVRAHAAGPIPGFARTAVCFLLGAAVADFAGRVYLIVLELTRQFPATRFGPVKETVPVNGMLDLVYEVGLLIGVAALVLLVAQLYGRCAAREAQESAVVEPGSP